MPSASQSPVNPPPVLLVEDDVDVAQVVREGLAARGFAVSWASTLGEGEALLSGGGFDAVILDLALPDGSGLTFTTALRRAGNDLPILMLTAQTSVQDRVQGFQHGADDYLCKPFDVDELAARLQAIVRRARAGARHVLEYADLRLDLLTRVVERHDRKATLSARETELLAYLMRHCDVPISRERILAEVWGDEAEDDSNVLNVYINYLRNKIQPGGIAQLIHTVRGVGYVLSLHSPDESMV